jgi:rare lipoprotein A
MMMAKIERKAPLLWLVMLICSSSCALFHHAPSSGGDEEEGEASFYASSLEGHRTASGEPYRGDALTCAHRTLPFGTLLEVRMLSNGRTVKVRVNDRGPFVSGRIIDVSYRAARELGLIARGSARVRLTVIKLGANSKR